MAKQLLYRPVDQRNQGRLRHRPPKSRTGERESGDLRNNAKLGCDKVAGERYSHAMEHGITTGEHGHSLLSAMLGEDLLHSWGHRRWPRNTACRRTRSGYEGEVASASVEQLGAGDCLFGLPVQPLVAIFAEAY